MQWERWIISIFQNWLSRHSLCVTFSNNATSKSTRLALCHRKITCLWGSLGFVSVRGLAAAPLAIYWRGGRRKGQCERKCSFVNQSSEQFPSGGAWRSLRGFSRASLSPVYGEKDDQSQGRMLWSLKIGCTVGGFPLRDLREFDISNGPKLLLPPWESSYHTASLTWKGFGHMPSAKCPQQKCSSTCTVLLLLRVN